MGMLSNTIFRIKLHRMKNAQGEDTIWFEHPTMPGVETGGWMTEDAGKFDPAIASEASPGKSGVVPSRSVAAVWKGAGEAALTADTKGVEKTTSDAVKREVSGKRVSSEFLKRGIPIIIAIGAIMIAIMSKRRLQAT